MVADPDQPSGPAPTAGPGVVALPEPDLLVAPERPLLDGATARAVRVACWALATAAWGWLLFWVAVVAALAVGAAK